MAESQFRGPLGAMGSLEAESSNATVATIEPMDGPSYSYQGITFLDPRTYPLAKDGTLPARIPAFYNNPYFCTVDAVPQALASNVVATASIQTTGAAMPLASTASAPGGTSACNIALGVPLVPQGTTVVTTVMALDFGFQQATCTANSSTVAVNDNTVFQQGGWYIISNVANAAGTSSLVTQVMSISSTNITTITVSPSPTTTLVANIGGANLWGSNFIALGSQFGPVNSTATAVSKTMPAGVQRIHNPRELLARNISVQASASTANGTGFVTVTGYDVWGQYMVEKITQSGTTAQYGQKAWKYILAVTASTTGAATVSVGIGDSFGTPMRLDEFEQLDAWWGNTSVINNVGIYPTSVVVGPTNNTAMDVRGVINIGTAALSAAITASAASNGTSRLTIFQSPGMERLITATPNNTVPLFGVVNATA